MSYKESSASGADDDDGGAKEGIGQQWGFDPGGEAQGGGHWKAPRAWAGSEAQGGIAGVLWVVFVLCASCLCFVVKALWLCLSSVPPLLPPCLFHPGFPRPFVLLSSPQPSLCIPQIYVAFRLRGEIDQARPYAFRGADKWPGSTFPSTALE